MTKFGHLNNYYRIKDSTEKFFSEDTTRIHDKSFGYKGFQRWKVFMESRVDENGSLATYHQNMSQEYENILLTDNDRIPGQWNSLGPVTGTTGSNAELGIVTSLLVENEQNIYAGTGASGLFVTHDGGTTWNSLTDNYLITGIESIIKTNNTIYIATGFDTWGKVYSKGVLKSTDDGMSWRETGLTSAFLGNKPFSVKAMVNDPDSSKYFYAILQEQYRNAAHIVKSSDFCSNWGTAPKFTKSETDLRKLEMDPFNSSRIIASGRCVVISTDKGENWTDITDSIPFKDDNRQYEIVRITTSFHPNIPNRILVMLKKNVDGKSYLEFYISDVRNDAYNFKKCLYGENQEETSADGFSEDKFELEWSQTNQERFYYAGIGVCYMRLSSSYKLYKIPINDDDYHVDIRYLKITPEVVYNDAGVPSSIDLIYHGNDGGVTFGYNSSEDGVHWIDISGTGLNITQFYGLAISESDPNFYVGGTQDGNIFIHNILGWGNRANIFDAAEAVINPFNPSIMYMVAFAGGLYLNRSTDGGSNWYPFRTGIFELDEGNFRRNDAPLEMSKVDPSVLFIGGRQVYKSRPGQSIFDKISNFYRPDSSYIKVIRVSPNNNNYIIAAKENMAWKKAENEDKINLTLNGGTKWYDVSPDWEGDFSLKDVGVFDIAINPDKPSNFFVALDRFNPSKKVFKGEWGYGGDTTVRYTNMSAGLPNLPVNCIKVYKGSENDEMFAGTDCGVYYYNKQIGHWIKYGHGMPVCAVSDLEINYKTNQLVASTFGRGMYIANLCEIGPAELDMYIADTLVWEDSDKRIPANIIIQPQGHLTITGKVRLKYGKSIIVQPGAFLVIDGGTITSHCETEPWGGIKVNGTPSGPQNPLYQGIVIVKNGSKIENAMVGIHSINPPQKDIISESGGGIIMASNSTFRNNRVAVQFERYSTAASISFFKKCIFETQSSSIVIENFKYFVKINDVKGGLFFGGCTFRNIPSINGTSEQITKTGIDSYNSQFIVDWYCSTAPCSKEDKSSFENLVYGLYATSTISSRSLKVNNSIFVNNDRGIYAENIYNPDIRFNKFNIGKDGEKNVGLYLNFCTGYVVEQDTFYFPTNSNYQLGTKGIVVNNSGDQDNHIYKNYFRNLEFGILAQDINRNKDGSRGLRIKCNDFLKTKSDIAITRSIQEKGYGIASAQGSAEDITKPAGNLFSNIENDLSYFGIDNDCDGIIYTYHDPIYNRRLEPSKIDNQFTIGKNNSMMPFSPACCPSHTTPGGGTLDSKIVAEKLQSDSIQSELNLLIDNGDTDGDLLMIATALPNENIQIHDNLMATSPFVSDTVIQAVISNENVFNNSMVKNIMVANPKSVKSDNVISDLNNRLDPMPEYLMDEIMEGLDTLSIRELMEIKMQIGLSNYSYGFNRLLSAMLNDSTAPLKDSVIGLLNVDNSFYSKIRKAWLLSENGDSTRAINTIDSIEITDQISTSQAIELNEQKAFLEWCQSVSEVDSTQVEILNYFLSSPSLYVSSRARRLLINSNSIEYEEPYILPENFKKFDVKEKRKQNKVVSSSFVKAYPNPAKDYITIEYSSGIEHSDCFILIYDSYSKLVKSVKSVKFQDQILLRTNYFKSGNYYVQLISDNKCLNSCKFTVIN